MFEDDVAVATEIAISNEAFDKVKSEAEVIEKQESQEWAKFALTAKRIDHALSERPSRWHTIHYAEISKYSGDEQEENMFATTVLVTDRFLVVYHSGQDEVFVLLKRDPKVLGKLFKRILPRLPLALVKVSYDWTRENSKLGAYVSFVNYDYNSDYQELYQLLQRTLAETLKQKTYDTQVTTEFKKLASFS